MAPIDLLYYAAGGLLVLMAYMRSAFHMRLCHLAASTVFLAYGCLAEVWPVAVLNGAMIAVHLLRLARLRGS
ncbi:MAG: hypothetical protein AAFY59_02310 [Pseudomonadota bacterium]